MDTIKLDGRDFRGISQDLTAAQDDYILAHVRRSGALEVLTDQKTPDDIRAEELLTRVMLAGETFHILAGCLTEVGKAWSRAEAERNAARFSVITDDVQKQTMRGSLIGFVLGFFDFARRSSETSPKSSSLGAEGRDTSSADPGTSETSLQSSAPAQDSTLAAWTV